MLTEQVGESACIDLEQGELRTTTLKDGRNADQGHANSLEVMMCISDWEQECLWKPKASLRPV
jgi:hypothetical protein